jgi:hypothetical protein
VKKASRKPPFRDGKGPENAVPDGFGGFPGDLFKLRNYHKTLNLPREILPSNQADQRILEEIRSFFVELPAAIC